jgi:hypothetical protein
LPIAGVGFHSVTLLAALTLESVATLALMLMLFALGKLVGAV